MYHKQVIVASMIAVFLCLSYAHASPAGPIPEDMVILGSVDVSQGAGSLSVIDEIASMYETASSEEIMSFSSMHGIKISDGKIDVVVALKDAKKPLNFDGIEAKAVYKNLFHARIPLSQIEKIKNHPDVLYIRKPLVPHALVVSEGRDTINATALHVRGVHGDGVKIAVIDMGFSGYNSNTEIWNVVEAISFTGDITGGGEVHGTACAEIVLDVAPDASLYLYNIGNEIHFAEALNRAISQGVDIITCSLGWVNAGPYDGTGDVCDIANNASANGILFVNSAGNQAKRHYEGIFDDTNGNDFHEFAPGFDEMLSLGYINNKYPINLFLSWDDWDAVDQDYDLYLYKYGGNGWYQVAGSQYLQDGSPGQFPVEEIFHTSNGGNYGVVIRSSSSREDAHLELYSFNNDFLQYNVESSSLTIPADAVGVMAVGATYWTDDSLEPFSSRGPTNDMRIKPDVTAPDGVSGSIYGLSTEGDGFFGTSSSAPHTAGAAALLLSSFPSLTDTGLRTFLESTAKDLNATGKDNLTGSGRIDVNAAYLALPVSATIIPPDIEMTSGDTNYTEMSVSPLGIHNVEIKYEICKDTDANGYCDEYKYYPWDSEISVVFNDTLNLHSQTGAGGDISIKIKLGTGAPPGAVYTYHARADEGIWVSSSVTSRDIDPIPEFPLVVVPLFLGLASYLFLRERSWAL